MRGIQFGAVVAILTLVALDGVVTSQAWAAAACDDKCRQRDRFYVCPAGGGSSAGRYWAYDRKVCDLCSSSQVVGPRCQVMTGDYPNSPCDRQGTVRRQLYDDGDLSCNCDTGINFVEAAPHSLPTDRVQVDRYICTDQPQDGGGS